MSTCGECGRTVGDARWCGGCGAPAPATDGDGATGRSPVVFVDEVPPVSVDPVPGPAPDDSVDGTSPPPHGGARRLGRVAVGVAAALLLTAVVLPADDPAPVAEEPTAWARRGVVAPPASGTPVVRPAGPDHVLVGASLLATDGDAGDGALPSPLHGALDREGRWAVAEAGRLVSGVLGSRELSVATVVSRRRSNAWRPIGPAVGWHDGAAVLRGSGGTVALVEPDGTIRWRTEQVVEPVEVRHGVARAVRLDGTAVAIDLDDGAIVPAAERPLPRVAVGGTVVTVGGDDVVSATGRTTWRSTVAGATAGEWTATLDGLVLTTAEGATLLDPARGTVRSRLAVVGGVPVADGVVVARDGALALVGWDGGERWRRSYRRAAPVRLHRVDDARVVAEVRGADGSTSFVVHDAADGRSTAAVDARRVVDGAPVTETLVGRSRVVAGAAWVVSHELRRIEGRGWLDVASGRDAGTDAAAAIGALGGPRGDAATADRDVGTDRVAVGVAVVDTTRRGGDPLGTLEPALVGTTVTGRTWRTTAVGPAPVMLAVPDSVTGPLLVEVGRAVLRVWGADTGRFVRAAVLPAPAAGPPTVAGAVVHVPLADGRLHTLDLDDGVEVTSAVGVVTAAAPTGCGTAVLGTASGRIVTVDGRGAVLDDRPVADARVRDLAVVDETVVLAAGTDVLGVPAPPAATEACTATRVVASGAGGG